MINQMKLLKNEGFLASIISERDQIIEGLTMQIDQMSKKVQQLEAETKTNMKPKKEESACGGPPCQQ